MCWLPRLPVGIALLVSFAASCAKDEEAPNPTRTPPAVPTMSPTGTLGAVSLPEMGSCLRSCAEQDAKVDCKTKCRETCDKHCAAQGSAFVDRCKKDCAQQIVNAGDN
jgi:hypothetical protein